MGCLLTTTRGSQRDVVTKTTDSSGFGASGIVGSAVVRHFAQLPYWSVIAVSRRPPASLTWNPATVRHVPLDLTDGRACAGVFEGMADVTHVVYAAVHEKADGVVAGWRADDQMQTNLAMLRNALEPLERRATGLQHVTVMQGTKAYGAHVVWPADWISTPASEDEPRHPHENFYWLQEDYITQKQALGKRWGWTIMRPRQIYGDAIGSNLSTIAVLGAYAALEGHAGRPLSYPGGPRYPLEAVDSDLLARAIAWAMTSTNARNQVFNVSNGDLYVWEFIWPVIAGAVGMPVGDPQPRSMVEYFSDRGDQWAQIVTENALAAPKRLTDFVGGSPALADFTFAYGQKTPPPPPANKQFEDRKAGFHQCMDTWDMFRKWIRRLQEAPVSS